jgi:hypothetical protein
MGNAIAEREGTPPVPNTPSDRNELVRELRYYAKALDVDARLRGYGAALDSVTRQSISGAHFYLIELEPAARRLLVRGYTLREQKQAAEDYLERIPKMPILQVVVIS